MRNPFSAEVTDSFQIQTIEYLNYTAYVIDKLNSSLSYLVPTIRPFSSANVTRSVVAPGQPSYLEFDLVIDNAAPA